MEVNAALSESAGPPGAERGPFAKSFDASSTSAGRKKSRRADWCKRESDNISKCLPHRPAGRSSKSEGRFARRSKAGWTPERRARQAELIHRSAPWRHSTGPKTDAGKARCAKNALRHGGRSRAHISELQRIRYVLRLAAENIKKVRLLIRLRDARSQIKYKPHYAPRGDASLGVNRALVRCSRK
jgi:hypothetical protein